VIQEQILKVMGIFSASRVQHESLVSLDFNTENSRNIFMRLSFSVLANWPIAIIFALLYLNPFRYRFLLQSLFADYDRFILFMYNENFLIAFLVFAIIGSILNFEIFFLAIIGWLISNGEVHVLISVGAAAGIIFSSARRNLKLISVVSPKVKSAWMYFSLVQMTSVAIASAVNYVLYLNLKNLGFFSATISVNRFEFFVAAVFVYYAIQLFLLSLWGHFYSRHKSDPADWKISYSTADIVNKLNLGKKFKSDLLTFCKEKLVSKSKNSEVEGMPDRLLKLSQSETEYLKKAVVNLS
jgi:hypothetical protein